MPRRVTVRRITPSYWDEFLENQNLIGAIADDFDGLEQPVQKQPVRGITADMETFAKRIASRLSPIHNSWPTKEKLKALNQRKETVKELTRVFTGKADFEAWFDRSKTKFHLHKLDFFQMLYDSLEGLMSKEAQGLRGQYGEVLESVRRGF